MHQSLIQEGSYRLYPNPVHDVLNWELESEPGEPISFIILDASGRLVYQGKATEKVTRTPVSQWAPGRYFLHWSKNRQSFITKLLKH